MKIGLILPTIGHGAGGEVLDAGAGVAARLGWNSVWVTDHLLVPAGPEAEEYGWVLEATTALTWVAARHESLKVGFSVIIPAMRDAPLLAKQLATLDVLTGGRLIVGVGASDKDDILEYENLGKGGERFERRGAYLDEAIALWRHLWSGRTDPFEGEFHQLRDFTFAPLPPQGGSLPIIWKSGGGPRSSRCVRSMRCPVSWTKRPARNAAHPENCSCPSRWVRRDRSKVANKHRNCQCSCNYAERRV